MWELRYRGLRDLPTACDRLSVVAVVMMKGKMEEGQLLLVFPGTVLNSLMEKTGSVITTDSTDYVSARQRRF
jgi:hypothetical protein